MLKNRIALHVRDWALLFWAHCLCFRRLLPAERSRMFTHVEILLFRINICIESSKGKSMPNGNANKARLRTHKSDKEPFICELRVQPWDYEWKSRYFQESLNSTLIVEKPENSHTNLPRNDFLQFLHFQRFFVAFLIGFILHWDLFWCKIFISGFLSFTFYLFFFFSLILKATSTGFIISFPCFTCHHQKHKQIFFIFNVFLIFNTRGA